MKLNPWKKEPINQENIGIVYSKPLEEVSNLNIFLKEQFKGELEKKDVKFKDIGEQHPFDFSITEGLYEKMGFVTGVVDKYVDFIVGPGFFVKSEDERAQKIIEDFMSDVNFDTLLRAWVKEALIKGNGFMEIGGDDNQVNGLKVLDSKNMFVKRDNKGVIKGYTQFIPRSSENLKEIKNDFSPKQIAHLALNKVADNVYGFGIVYPAINTINNILGSEKDMHTILKRKANSPYHVKIGSLTTNPPILPSQSTVDAWGARLQFLNARHEWVTGPDTEIDVKEFGNVGEKFEFVLRHDKEMLFATFQVPEVLLGAGNIPEGLAKVQMDGFERNVQSKQVEAEKIIETQIFNRVLQGNGIDAHVEFEWGQPSNTERNERIQKLTELMKSPFVSLPLRMLLEEETASLLGLRVEELEDLEAQREREEEREQPIVPGQNREEVLNIHESLVQDKDYSLKEWLGFNYNDYLDSIFKYLAVTKFSDLLAKNSIELQAGMLSATQVNQLRNVLGTSFKKELSIIQIADEIEREVKPQDLFRMKNGKILKNINGDPKIRITAEKRALEIARTQTTRSANAGAVLHFKEGGVERLRFVASIGPRTCPICASLNGLIFDINELVQGINQPDIHTYCRCTMVPVTGE